MDQEPVQIKRHIDAERERLGQDFEEIGHRMKDAVDWRSWYNKNTVAMLGAAAAGGFLLSRLVAPNPAPNPRPAGFQGRSPHVNRMSEVLEDTVAAIIGVGAAKLHNFVSEAIPGFREQYSEAQRHRE